VNEGITHQRSRSPLLPLWKKVKEKINRGKQQFHNEKKKKKKKKNKGAYR